MRIKLVKTMNLNDCQMSFRKMDQKTLDPIEKLAFNLRNMVQDIDLNTRELEILACLTLTL